MKAPLTRWTSYRRRWPAVLAAAMAVVPALVVPAQADDPLDPILGNPGITLPNLVPDVQTVSITQFKTLDPATGTLVPVGPLELHFDTWAQNFGSVALQLTADDANAAETTVSQCVSWRAEHVCREQRPVGGYGLDPDHNHFHFQEFANYELRTLLQNGRVDYSTKGLVEISEKVSFCMIDSAQQHDDASPLPFYETCGGTVQGISPGWGDHYSIGTPGQTFPVDRLTDGRYAIVIDMDYADHLYESDETDNVTEVVIEISGGVTQVAIIGRNP